MAISLQKGHKVSLEKKSPAGLGEIHVNLNWNSVPQNQGFIKKIGRASWRERVCTDV